ncbi:EthD domain-containing protein [Nocardia sp. CA-107356]|uniref:EthD domain-containing protein n=1 Tax=Nocardia sp. CA-107356 TaxID=3239972 RepID=UPI003D8B8D76
MSLAEADGPLIDTAVTRWWFAARRLDLSHARFVQHWRGPHADIAMHLPALQSYRQYHVLADYEPECSALPVHGCARMNFPLFSSMAMAMNGSVAARASADEPTFVDIRRCFALVTRHVGTQELRPRTRGETIATIDRDYSVIQVGPRAAELPTSSHAHMMETYQALREDSRVVQAISFTDAERAIDYASALKESISGAGAFVLAAQCVRIR